MRDGSCYFLEGSGCLLLISGRLLGALLLIHIILHLEIYVRMAYLIPAVPESMVSFS